MRSYVKLFRSGDINQLEKVVQKDLDNNTWRLQADHESQCKNAKQLKSLNPARSENKGL